MITIIISLVRRKRAKFWKSWCHHVRNWRQIHHHHIITSSPLMSSDIFFILTSLIASSVLFASAINDHWFHLYLWTSRPKVNFSTPSPSSSWLTIIINSYNNHHHYYHNQFGTIYHSITCLWTLRPKVNFSPPVSLELRWLRWSWERRHIWCRWELQLLWRF